MVWSSGYCQAMPQSLPCTAVGAVNASKSFWPSTSRADGGRHSRADGTRCTGSFVMISEPTRGHTESPAHGVVRQLRCQAVGIRTVGVEEELLLVDAHRERMTPVATRVLRIATARGDAGDEDVGPGSLTCELQEQQLELYTSPHHSMSTLEAELRFAQQSGVCPARARRGVVASATSLFGSSPAAAHAALRQDGGGISPPFRRWWAGPGWSSSGRSRVVGARSRTRCGFPRLLALG